MRILHIGDQAGVACILAKYQRLQGHESKVLKIKDQDKYGISSFYKNYICFLSPAEDIIKQALKEAADSELVHIHSSEDMLFILRNKFGTSKKIILHYHGTDLRGINKQKLPHRSWVSDIAVKSIYEYRRIKDILLSSSKKKKNLRAQRLADAVIVSTPDLLQFCTKHDAVYLPNPVDIEHFKPDIIKKNTLKEAITMDTEVTDINWAISYCKKKDIDLEIEVCQRMQRPIMYAEMPSFLNQYKIYIDIRYVNKRLLENLSKTALEALACGLRVLDYKLNYLSGLPSEHNPANVVSNLFKIYSNIQ
jgi:glycosyltransferase involved in cell wall biosynthesis